MTITEIIEEVIKTNNKRKTLILLEGKLATAPSLAELMLARKWYLQIQGEIRNEISKY